MLKVQTELRVAIQVEVRFGFFGVRWVAFAVFVALVVVLGGAARVFDFKLAAAFFHVEPVGVFKLAPANSFGEPGGVFALTLVAFFVEIKGVFKLALLLLLVTLEV
mgnify:CR=1 FL=1